MENKTATLPSSQNSKTFVLMRWPIPVPRILRCEYEITKAPTQWEKYQSCIRICIHFFANPDTTFDLMRMCNVQSRLVRTKEYKIFQVKKVSNVCLCWQNYFLFATRTPRTTSVFRAASKFPEVWLKEKIKFSLFVINFGTFVTAWSTCIWPFGWIQTRTRYLLFWILLIQPHSYLSR